MRAKNSLWYPTAFFAWIKTAGLCGLLLSFKTQRQKRENLFPITQNNCERMPYDRKTMDSAIKALESKGLVKKVYRHRADGTMTSNLYYLTDLLDTG